MRTVWKMLAINPMLFASLITAHKAAVENPEQTVDIHKPPNTPVPDRVKLISPAGSLGNQHLVKQEDAAVSNTGQRHPMNCSGAAPSEAAAEGLAAATTRHCTFCSDHCINKMPQCTSWMSERGLFCHLAPHFTIMFTVSIKFRDAAGSLMQSRHAFQRAGLFLINSTAS